MLAAVGAEIYTDLLEAQSMVRIRQCFEPDTLRTGQYNHKYQVYSQIYNALKELHYAM